MLTVLLALALAADLPPTPALRTGKPELRLIVRPDLALWHGHAVYVIARVRLEDPHREIPCPELLVEWGDGDRSGIQAIPAAGCDPFGLDAPTLYRWNPRMHAYRGPGEFSVVACVVNVIGACRGGALRVRRVVRVVGPGDIPSPEKWARRASR